MIPGRVVRVAVVGAGTLLGKELAEFLNEPSSQLWDITLLDAGSAGGQLTSAGDEALVIQPMDVGAFTGMDLVFFAGDEATTLEHWQAAANADVSIVDMTGALAGQPGVATVSPWVTRDTGSAALALDLSTVAVVSAHPAAVMLATVLSKLHGQFGLQRAIATVLEPASQQGSAGLDELHGQTVSLLSFQELPKSVFDAQVAFNMNAALGSEAKVDLQDVTARVREHLKAIGGDALAARTAIQLVQAPVFSGYTASLFVEVDQRVELDVVLRTLNSGIVSVPGVDDAPPSNQSATQEDKLLIQVRFETPIVSSGSAFWIWMAADNLQLAVRNAVGCATELLALRPGSKLQ